MPNSFEKKCPTHRSIIHFSLKIQVFFFFFSVYLGKLKITKIIMMADVTLSQLIMTLLLFGFIDAWTSICAG